MTKEELQKQVDNLNDLLPYVDFKAVLEDDDPNDIFIGLCDLQGANLGEIEQEKFYSAQEVVERMDWYWEDTFLDGEICCNYDRNFYSYEEAEAIARDTGYTDVADAILLLAKLAKWDFHPVRRKTFQN